MNKKCDKLMVGYPRNLFMFLFVLISFALSSVAVSAQVTDNKYTDSNIKVQHKRAKWYGLREVKVSEDTFDDSNSGFTKIENGTEIQTAHVAYDTIYVHKGTNETLTLPSVTNGTFFQTPYQRWYNYLTDGSFSIPNHPNEVYDLLTPSFYMGISWLGNNYGTTCYRTQNGYLSGSKTNANSVVHTMNFYYPTDEEYENWFGEKLPDKFVVACDYSSYTDFADKYVKGGTEFGSTTDADGNTVYWEPTLMGRNLFVLIALDSETEENENHYRLMDKAFQGGTNTGNEKYLEEYEISYPFYRISNNTKELVTLAEMAESYVVPGEKNFDTDVALNVQIDNNANSMGIYLLTNAISGTNRAIYFDKNNWWDGAKDGSKSTILVTREVGGTTYNIARYKLTFNKATTPMTQHQVDLIDGVNNLNTWWGVLTHRKPDYMKENFDVITQRDFDYDINLAKTYNYRLWQNKEDAPMAKIRIYPYPLDWAYSDYLFFDGSMWADGDFQTLHNDAKNGNVAAYNDCSPQYETYCITADYCSQPEVSGTIPAVQDEALQKDPSSYYLYVDASDSPGIIVELPFEENLCTGSELFVTAWMKSAGDSSSDDAAALFTVVGVNEDGSEDILYRHCSGQIRTTTWLTQNAKDQGFGSGTNDWYQIYFSFINTFDHDYKSYFLRVENYCSSTNGGDFYLDEIKVWVYHHSVDIQQKVYTCNDDKTLMRMNLSYETLMSRLGHKESDYIESSESSDGEEFIIINMNIYDDLLEQNIHNGQDDLTAKANAIRGSIVNVGEGEGYNNRFPSLKFFLYYDKNKEYDENGTNLAKSNEGYFYRTTDLGGKRYLSVDLQTPLMPYIPYMIVFRPATIRNESEEEKLEYFAERIGEYCTIEEEFYVVSQTLLKINGETIDPYDEAQMCAGQVVEFSAQARYEDKNGDYHNITDNVFFDWFLGSAKDFIWEWESYNEESVYSALTSFRSVYPDAESLGDSYESYKEDLNKDNTVENGYVFTESQYKMLKKYVAAGKLLLHKIHIDIRIAKSGVNLVCQPIDNGIMLPEGSVVCLSYVELAVRASGNAPILNMGFPNMDYPADDYTPSLRIGLDQIKESSAEKPITINLRGAQSVQDEDTIDVDHIGLATAGGLDLLYLVDTNDPHYNKYGIGQDNFDQFSLPVGTIKSLYAEIENDGENQAHSDETGSSMQIYFDTDKYIFNEGFYYVMTVHYEQKDSEGQTVGTACQGTFPLEMKVVPEYLVWRGSRSDNWNDDEMWKRAEPQAINKLNGAYLNNDENGTDNGFVPTQSSKVVIPKDSSVELYMAGFIDVDGNLTWTGDSNKPDGIVEEPTENIMYDLTVLEDKATNSFNASHFRMNVCDQIHLEAGAQILHPELLLYDKAWMDVEIPQSKWTLVSLPLRGVVSGDWYTKPSGTETGEYFKSIVFIEKDNGIDDDFNDRLNPLVYQRRWSKDDAVIVSSDDKDKDVPIYTSTGWSSVYNDASVPFTVGEGFSIKSYSKDNDTQKLMFRFPKSDESFNVSTDTLRRFGSGRFLVSDFANRSNANNDGANLYDGGREYIEVELTPTKNGYCLVGNPFTASMSMAAFFNANEILTGSYWLNSPNGPIVGNGNISSSGDGDFLLEPCNAFFAQVDNDKVNYADNKIKIRFTKDMQRLDDDAESHEMAFSIKAIGEEGTSSAALIYSENASDDYDSNEDAILMEDASWKKSGTPLVYTVAGGNAVSVNRLKSRGIVPIGVFCQNDDKYTLIFTGVGSLDNPRLYDSFTNTETTLTDGYAINMEGASHGRYFLCSEGASMIDIIDVGKPQNLTVYSATHRSVTVSSDTELRSVEVYSTSGMLNKKVNVGSGRFTYTLEGIDSGVAIVKAYTAEGTFVRKLLVR